MKKTLVFAALSLILVFSGAAGAQMLESEPGMMHDDAQGQANPAPQDMPDMMYPGMMGGYGMGPGMMGGYGMGPGMMGGCGMGPGMMGNYGYGMGPGMMGPYGCGKQMRGDCKGMGRGQSKEDHEKFRKVMDETRELRRKLYMMKFDYREMLRNPDTTLKDKMEMEKAMFDLQQQIREKVGQ